METENILSRLSLVKRQGKGQYTALCPCHDDHRPSLAIKEGDKGVVMSCPVCGADGKAVMQALGLDVRELFYQPAQAQRLPQKPRGEEYLYSDVLKKERFYVWNAQKQGYDKAFCWYHKEQGEWKKGKGEGQPPLYKWQNINWARRHGKTVYIVEGEKDVNTLTQKLRLPAVCSPHGAGRGRLEKKWLSDYNRLFEGADVAILADNDKPGRELARHIARQLLPYARSVKLPDLSFEWEGLKEKGDITDIFESDTPIPGKTLAETVALRLGSLTLTTPCVTPEQPGEQKETEPEQEKQAGSKSKYIRLSEVESTAAEWLWYPYIPRGKITLMTADPGTGKTFLSLYLASQVSTGRPFYGETEYREPAAVVYQTAEDGISDTIKPRLEPMRPNFENIYIFNEEREALSLSSERIEEIMRDLSPSLMIFDPLQAYLGAAVDMHRANEVRPVLGRIAHLAEKYRCAVLFIMHNSKSSQPTALHRALGSVDIPAVARSMIMLGDDPESPGCKLMCHEKSSLAAHGKSIRFAIEPHLGGITFSGYSDLKASDMLSPHCDTRKKASPKRDALCDAILELFGEEDSIEVESIDDLCDRLGCSQATLYRAKRELGIKSTRKGYSKEHASIWIKPDIDFAFDDIPNSEEDDVE